MKTTRKVTCPNCGRDVESPLTLITAKQIQMLPDIKDKISTDNVLYKHITNFGGVVPSEDELKQVTYEGDPPKELQKYIYGDTIQFPTGTGRVNQLACPHCHNNITPLYHRDITSVKNILLIGVTGSSKTALITSIAKLLAERELPMTKSEHVELASSPQSYEYQFYNSTEFPKPPTQHDDMNPNRQPLFYCKVNGTLLIFHDYPGEALKNTMFTIPKNSIPVYLFDNNAEEKDVQDRFLNAKVDELHQNGETYSKEMIAFVKCDELTPFFCRRLMIKPYEESKFHDFAGLLAARRMFEHENELPTSAQTNIYHKLKQYGTVDVTCVAAFGCRACEQDGEYKLEKAWNPQYLWDFLLSLV